MARHKSTTTYNKNNQGSSKKNKEIVPMPQVPIEMSDVETESDIYNGKHNPPTVSESPPATAVKLKKTPADDKAIPKKQTAGHLNSNIETVGEEDQNKEYRDGISSDFFPKIHSGRLSTKFSHPEMRTENLRDPALEPNLVENAWGGHIEQSNKTGSYSFSYGSGSSDFKGEKYKMNSSIEDRHTKQRDRHCTEERDYDDRSSPISMEPIATYTCASKSTKKIKPGDQMKIEDENFSREDLLAELRNVARREARVLEQYPDYAGEMYFQPPISPSKLSNSFYKDDVIPDVPVHKHRRIEPNEDTFLDGENADFKSFNDFDESIFKFDMRAKLFFCPWDGCNKSFPSLSRIKRHYIIHTDIKPFKCLNPGCDRRFSRKDNMLQHYRVHCPYAPQFKDSP